MEKFSTTDAGEWETFVGQGHYPLSVSSIGPRFMATAQRVDLSRMVHVSEMRVGESTLVRSRSLIKRFPSDDLLLLLQLTGSAQIEQGDHRMKLRAGSATWFDPASPYSIANQSGHQLVVTVPRRDILRPRQSATELRLRPMQLTSAPLRVFRLLAEEMISTAGDDHWQDGEGISQAAVSLMRSAALRAAGKTRERPSHLPETTAVAARAFVKDNIADVSLGVEKVAAAVHVSVRHLTSTFGPEDSPGAYIRRIRLDGARADLADPAHSHRTVADIAAQHGYSDPSAFTRAFKRQFGDSPRNMR